MLRFGAAHALMLIGLAVSTTAQSIPQSDSQQSTSSPSTSIPQGRSGDLIQRYCDELSAGIAHGDALSKACAFAFTIQQTAPNYLCRENIVSSPRGGDWLYSGVQARQVSAEVRFVNGVESYTDVRVGGRVVHRNIANFLPQYTVGEFVSILPALFSKAAGAKFSSAQDTILHDAPMLAFHFTVQHATNHGLWYLRSQDKTFYPGYGGQIWVDHVTLHLRRIDMRATELTGFPAVSHHVNIEYADTALGDGTSFVLPVRASIENCTTPSKCIANDLTFTNCHKFRAESRVVPAR